MYARWGAAAARGVTCDRELLEIMLAVRDELTVATASRVPQLRVLLLAGTTPTEALARGSLSAITVLRLVRRPASYESRPEQVTHAADIQRLARVVCDYCTESAANRDPQITIVNDLAPDLTSRPAMGRSPQPGSS